MWGLILSLLFLLAFMIIIVLGVWLVVGSMPPQERTGAPTRRSTSHAIEILRARYARGEIDKEEYDQRRRDLEAG